MTDLHPHWHATTDAPSASTARTSRHVSIQPASRLPAAVVGIVIIAGMVLTAVGGWDALFAQVTGGSSTSGTSTGAAALPSVRIRITPTGLQPQRAIVRPGQEIVWSNEQAIPHILTSTTLRDQSGSYLNTPAIFPGSEMKFRVGPKEPDREHTYGSTTDPSITGAIVVSASGQAASASSQKAQPLGSLDGVGLPTGQSRQSSKGRSSSAPAGGTVPPASTTNPVSPSVPETPTTTNPFAADPTQTDPYTGMPLSAFGPPDQNFPPIDQNAIAPLAPHPLQQPDTGPGVWIVVALSAGALAWVTRRCFARIERMTH